MIYLRICTFVVCAQKLEVFFACFNMHFTTFGKIKRNGLIPTTLNRIPFLQMRKMLFHKYSAKMEYRNQKCTFLWKTLRYPIVKECLPLDLILTPNSSNTCSWVNFSAWAYWQQNTKKPRKSQKYNKQYIHFIVFRLLHCRNCGDSSDTVIDSSYGHKKWQQKMPITKADL